ncbi:MAG: protein jag [Syntrophomonadaceae bacterium]|nr:protein jag [Syntrophomonadaceae bacterium]
MPGEVREVEKTGKNIEEAVEIALAELEIDREDAEIEILEEGNKGLFGIIGNRAARVIVKEKKRPEKIIRAFIEKVFEAMHIEAEMQLRTDGDHFYVNFHGKDLGILIGRRGDTLDALQYLVSLAVNREVQKRVRIILDVEEYRRRREETLMRLAQRLSEKVRRTQKHVVLEPMNPQERRVIHTALQNDPAVYTFSQGNEPYRKVVISPKK